MKVASSVWVIMDPGRKVIAKGVPRNRYLVMLDDPRDRKRVLTYRSRGVALSACTNYGFYEAPGVSEYLDSLYGKDRDRYHHKYLEPVEARLVLEIDGGINDRD